MSRSVGIAESVMMFLPITHYPLGKAQTASDPAQQKRLAILDRLIDQKLTEVENTINLRKQGFDTASLSLSTEQSKDINAGA